MKKLQNNFTTPEQSKRLLELGVPADSADCYYTNRRMTIWHRSEFDKVDWSAKVGDDLFYIPCWSVGRLMEIIDICEIDPKDEEYPTTKMIKDETKMDYIDYLVGTVRMMLSRLDFSKLEE